MRCSMSSSKMLHGGKLIEISGCGPCLTGSRPLLQPLELREVSIHFHLNALYRIHCSVKTLRTLCNCSQTNEELLTNRIKHKRTYISILFQPSGRLL